MDTKNLSNTERLSLDISKRLGKHNIPAIFLAGDRDKKHSCVVMDSRKEMREINISVVMDAIMNGEETGELANVLMTASCILCANIPAWGKRFMELLESYKKEQKPVTTNKAEA